MSTNVPVVPLQLARYDSEPLQRSPLVLVAAQINFEEIGTGVSHAQAREIQKALDASWTSLQPAPQMRVTLTATGPVSETSRSAYRLQSSVGAWSLVISPDSVTLETQNYPGWGKMAPQIESVADAVAKVFDPSQCLRLGLRYIDKIPLPDGHDNWDGLIPAAIRSLLSDPTFGGSVLGSDQRHMLQLEEGALCMFHHGLQADDQGRASGIYLLDYDVFDQSPRAFAVGDIMAATTVLHQHTGALFRASLDDTLYEWLKGDEK
ncbi:TIGR04255 family protein [Antrihabitans stalactiti]|uniref:TIGR04255 family protein n=1 Tax=Antrihabitans stalactiti TaxID=2584121 RepID=UPI00146E6B6D